MSSIKRRSNRGFYCTDGTSSLRAPTLPPNSLWREFGRALRHTANGSAPTGAPPHPPPSFPSCSYLANLSHLLGAVDRGYVQPTFQVLPSPPANALCGLLTRWICERRGEKKKKVQKYFGNVPSGTSGSLKSTELLSLHSNYLPPTPPQQNKEKYCR